MTSVCVPFLLWLLYCWHCYCRCFVVDVIVVFVLDVVGSLCGCAVIVVGLLLFFVFGYWCYYCVCFVVVVVVVVVLSPL